MNDHFHTRGGPAAAPRTGRRLGGLFCGIMLAATTATAADVALTVEEPGGVARAAWPVTGGVPFGPGDLSDAKVLGLWRSDGTPAPLQTDVLARWPDGSVRWLLVDFQADLSPGQKAAFRLRRGPCPTAAPAASPLRVTESTGSTVIVTGPLRIELTRDGFDPLGAVWLDRNRDGNFAPDERVTQGGGGLFLRDAQERRFDAARSPVEIAVEEAGPLRACVRITGRYAADDGTLFRHIVRLHAFAGRPYVRCFHTFVNDRQDTLMAGIKELGVTVRLADSAGPAGSAALGGHPAGGGRILQVDETRYELDGQAAGTRARGWAAAAGTHAGFATGVREFWQQWPKSVEARNGEVTLGLCPDFPAALYDGKPLAEENKLYYALRGGLHTFKIGMAKTHEFWAVFFAAPAEPVSLDAFFQSAEEPLLPVCTPVYAGATQVAGRFPAPDRRDLGACPQPHRRLLHPRTASGRPDLPDGLQRQLRAHVDHRRPRLLFPHRRPPRARGGAGGGRCDGNVPFMEGLTVCALSRLHRHTGDPEVLKAIGAGIDQMIRECWQEDVKTFRYTACPLSTKAPYGLFLLSVEAMAYEARLTGNREHLRILREGFRAAIRKSGDDFGKSLGQMTFFAPHALEAMD